MPQSSTNVTFNPCGLADTKGRDDVYITATVELHATDPSDITTVFPRVWINTTTFTLKYTINGTTVKSVALT